MLPDKKIFTYDEFLEIDSKSDDLLEFIDGIIYNMASPSTLHQIIVTNLSLFLGNYFKNSKCRMMIAPYDIIFKTEIQTNRVQPDISIICNKDGFNKNNYVGSPTLVIEVLSPSTTSKDFITKMDLYMKNGVKEYWIVSPDKKDIQIFNFIDNQLKDSPVTYRGDELLISNIFNDLKIDLKEIFNDSE